MSLRVEIMRKKRKESGHQKFEMATKLAQARRPKLNDAFKLFSEAEILGHAEATYALATWYLFGRHVEKNLRKAVILLKRASRRGSADAAFDLAIGFEAGKIVPKDDRKAFELFLTAALRYEREGDVQTMFSFGEAAYEVARCYHHGIGVTVDKVSSRIWMREGRAFRANDRTAS